MNALGLDPKNIGYEFRREWQSFQSGRIKPFFVAFLNKELADARRVLENVSPQDLGKTQGIVFQLKKTLNLVEQPHSPDEVLKQVLDFLEER